MKNILLFTETFNSEGYEVTIIPDQGAEGIVFRGILDRRWLRIEPELIRALYGGFVESRWTMVGHVTYLPGVELPRQEEIINQDEENPSMRDPYRNLFRASRSFERMFIESKQRIEVIICPLAIYREIPIPTLTTSASGTSHTD